MSPVEMESFVRQDTTGTVISRFWMIGWEEYWNSGGNCDAKVDGLNHPGDMAFFSMQLLQSSSNPNIHQSIRNR
ncbi:hypothetical protein PDESU_02907 [Pontiella desulfatans]|uniref:Uncharacterized protein n=1 Tax=Pontiella desulfatans TaxID=2750659 RepID=A0A6C2U3A7_PONDE|nr:hypothetical protein PDESU_02907 [Pontiella desulfatans]